MFLKKYRFDAILLINKDISQHLLDPNILESVLISALQMLQPPLKVLVSHSSQQQWLQP